MELIAGSLSAECEFAECPKRKEETPMMMSCPIKSKQEVDRRPGMPLRIMAGSSSYPPRWRRRAFVPGSEGSFFSFFVLESALL